MRLRRYASDHRFRRYLRVPMADIGPIKVPESVTDDQALFLSDIFPTG